MCSFPGDLSTTSKIKMWKLVYYGNTPINTLLRSRPSTQLQLHCPLLAADACSLAFAPSVKLAQPPPQRFTCCCNDSGAKDWLLLCNYASLRPLADKISAGAAEAAVLDLFMLRAAPHLFSPDILKTPAQSFDPVYFCFFSAELQSRRSNTSLHSKMYSGKKGKQEPN